MCFHGNSYQLVDDEDEALLRLTLPVLFLYVYSKTHEDREYLPTATNALERLLLMDKWCLSILDRMLSIVLQVNLQKKKW